MQDEVELVKVKLGWFLENAGLDSWLEVWKENIVVIRSQLNQEPAKIRKKKQNLRKLSIFES